MQAPCRLPTRNSSVALFPAPSVAESNSRSTTPVEVTRVRWILSPGFGSVYRVGTGPEPRAGTALFMAHPSHTANTKNAATMIEGVMGRFDLTVTVTPIQAAGTLPRKVRPPNFFSVAVKTLGGLPGHFGRYIENNEQAEKCVKEDCGWGTGRSGWPPQENGRYGGWAATRPRAPGCRRRRTPWHPDLKPLPDRSVPGPRACTSR